jgi:heavy metal sensor kinase
MKLSIRTRLTLWYASLLAASLIAFGATVYYSLFKVFTDDVDRQINSVAGMMVHAVIGPRGRLIVPRDFDLILERFFGIRTTGNFIQILSPEGVVHGKSSTLEGFILHLSEKAHGSVRRGETTYEIVDTLGRYPVRVVTKPVIIKEKGLVAIIQVGSSLEGLERMYYYIVYVFAIGTAFVVLLASTGGWLLAGRALKPVDRITTTARRIEAENLSERIMVDNWHDEIGRLAATFNEMIERLEYSFERIRQFTGDASHELRTPLTVLKGEIEVALRGRESSAGDMRAVLVSALEEIDRMGAIVNNLLDLARADVGAMTAKPEPVRIDAVARERAELLRRAAEEKGIGLGFSSDGPLMVRGDRLRLSQLVFNLIDNAVKYTPENGRVDVNVFSEDGFAVVRVSDTGIGIAAGDLPHIFDRFYRVDKARTGGGVVGGSAGGAGLGLSICREIANQHHGSIDVESEIGDGSRFMVRIPLLREI